MSDLNKLTLSQAIDGIKKKIFSEKEIINDCLAQIRKVESKIFSFITVNSELNDGVPMAVKDVLATSDLKTTASSRILENYFSPFEATVVTRLKKGGMGVIGKTNSDAFAFGASTENSGFGPTRNPWDLKRVAGGSSGGSAAAVASDECIFALGTDTGGSIRQPASFCSISGLKPTYGACSRYGLLAMASSFDCPGPMAKTVEDCEIIFNLMKGKDGFDATSIDESRKYKRQRKRKKLKIGLPKEFFAQGVDREVIEIVKKAAIDLQNNDFEMQEISLPHTEYAISAYYILVPAEISSNMSRYDGIRFGHARTFLEKEVKRRIMLGTYTLSAGYFDQYYLKALKVRSLIQKDYFEAFNEVDLIMGPISPTPPFKIGEKVDNPLKMYLADILTVGANLAGIPALALPCGFTKENLPVGFQILGPHFSENLLFEVGKKYQSFTDWHKKRPTIIK